LNEGAIPPALIHAINILSTFVLTSSSGGTFMRYFPTMVRMMRGMFDFFNHLAEAGLLDGDDYGPAGVAASPLEDLVQFIAPIRTPSLYRRQFNPSAANPTGSHSLLFLRIRRRGSSP
jgi:hypothetical protein